MTSWHQHPAACSHQIPSQLQVLDAYNMLYRADVVHLPHALLTILECMHQPDSPVCAVLGQQ